MSLREWDCELAIYCHTCTSTTTCCELEVGQALQLVDSEPPCEPSMAAAVGTRLSPLIRKQSVCQECMFGMWCALRKCCPVWQGVGCCWRIGEGTRDLAWLVRTASTDHVALQVASASCNCSRLPKAAKCLAFVSASQEESATI